jgi:hypothetical protein
MVALIVQRGERKHLGEKNSPLISLPQPAGAFCFQ